MWRFPLIYFLEKNTYEFLNSPVPIIIGVDSKMADYKFRVNINNISNNLVTFFIKEDIVEKDDMKVMQPSFMGRIDNIQKRYLRLQKYLNNPAQVAFKSKNTLFQSFLNKCRQVLDETILHPLLRNDLFNQPTESIINSIVSEHKKEAKFFELVCSTQMFISLAQSLKDSADSTDPHKSAFFM